MPAKIELATLAKGHAQEALDTMLTIMRDPAQPGATRLGAASALMDRGYGKPFQAVYVSGPNEGPIQTIDPSKMSPEALREFLAAVKHEASEGND